MPPREFSFKRAVILGQCLSKCDLWKYLNQSHLGSLLRRHIPSPLLTQNIWVTLMCTDVREMLTYGFFIKAEPSLESYRASRVVVPSTEVISPARESQLEVCVWWGGGGVTGTQQEETRDGAKYLRCTRQPSTTKNYPAPNASGVDSEQPCQREMGISDPNLEFDWEFSWDQFSRYTRNPKSFLMPG